VYLTATSAWLLVRATQVGLAGWGSGSDVNLFLSYARRWVAGGVPYVDFPVEYPPGALPLFVIPLLVGRPGDYARAFAFEMGAFDLIALLVVVARARQLRPRTATFVAQAAAVYLLMTAALFPVLYTRFDLAPAALTLAALHLAYGRHEVAGAALIGAAGMVKAWPWALVPILVLKARRAGSARHALLTAAAAGLGAMVIAAPLWPHEGRALAGVVGFHRARGLEIESTWATLAFVLDLLHVAPARLRYEFGAFHLTGGVAGTMALVAPAATAVCALIPIVWAWRNGLGGEPDHRGAVGFQAAAATVLGLLITWKVLSPQYAIWLAPLVSLAATDMPAIAASLSAAVLTTVSYPYVASALEMRAPGHGIAVLCVGLRNALLVGLYVAMLRQRRHGADGSENAGHVATTDRPACATDLEAPTEYRTYEIPGIHGVSSAALALVAALITAGQVGLFVSRAPGETFGKRYLSAFQWDSVWYADIALRGYVTSDPPVPIGERSNVTHFPGYPLVIAAFRAASGLALRRSALLTTQLCAWGFWTYVLLFLRRWRVTAARQALVITAIAAHPAAFFLITAYSEATFLLSALGFWYWYSRRDGAVSATISAFHGVLLTASRLAGAACAVAPLAEAIVASASTRVRRPSWRRAAGVALVSLIGVGLFFAYCAARFGRWNLYQVRQTLGWGHQPDFLAVLYPSAYPLSIPDWRDEAAVGAFANPYTLAALGLYACVCLRRRSLPSGFGLIVMAAATFYVTICGLYHTHFPAMARHQFAIHAMLLVAVAELYPRLDHDAATSPRAKTLRLIGLAVVIAAAVWSLNVQLNFASMFARRGPVF
jgi:hypothetical protein